MFRYIFITILVTVNVLTVKAQEQTERSVLQPRLDSIQRIIMRDSLSVSDETITAIYAIREEYFQKVKQVRRDTALTLAEQENKLQQLRKKINDGIREHLGEKAYEHYLQMIRGKVKKRTGQTDTKPLAGVTEI